MNKIKPRDLLFVLDSKNNIKFGILNKDKTKFMTLSDGEIYNIAKNLRVYYWNEPFVKTDSRFYAIRGTKDRKEFVYACPLILGKEDKQKLSYITWADENSDSYVAENASRFYLSGNMGTDKIEQMLEVICGVGQLDKSSAKRGFVNDNRNRFFTVENILKLEKSINNAKNNMLKKQEQKQESYTQADYDMFLSF